MMSQTVVSGKPSGTTDQKSQVTRFWVATSSMTIARERVLLLLAGLFTVTGLMLLALVRTQSDAANVVSHVSPRLDLIWLVLAFVAWTLCFGTIHVFLNRYQRERDPLLLPFAALLTGLGLIEIARLAPNFVTRQLIWLVVSSGVLVLVLKAPTDLKWLRRYKYTWLLIGLLLLALTFLVGVNPEGAGLTLWLGGPLGVFFQPAELLKLLFIAYLAAFLAEKREIARSLGVHPEHPHRLTLPCLDAPADDVGRGVDLVDGAAGSGCGGVVVSVVLDYAVSGQRATALCGDRRGAVDRGSDRRVPADRASAGPH